MSQVLQVNGDYLVKVSDGGTITLDTGTRVGDVVVTGNLVVDNNLTVNGSLTLGNEGSDNILVLGEISSDLKPKIANIYDLGSQQKYWRTLFVSQIRNPFGSVTINDLVEPVDPQDAATKNYVDSALGSVDNVFYVAKSGNDLNDGRTLSKAKLTIKSAVEAATLDITRGYDVTIFVKSGDYTEDNPIRLPEKLSIFGDGLRATTIRPLNKTQDVFWLNNGNYIANVTFKDHEAPGSAVAFPPPTIEFPAFAIHTSPYVQNCTSMTTTGCGMRVDGNYVKGLKSMVVDAYTQYNQGGIGIHMLNLGNTQLVSAFTINCDIAFLCTGGGFCSLTNSNSSFGNFGLVADGVSEARYSGILTGSKIGIIGDTIVLNNLITRPNVGDAVSFNGATSYYTVTIAQELAAGDIPKTQPDFSNQIIEYRTARQLIRAGKDKIATDTIDFVNDTYRDLNYNQFKCTRDTNLIIDAAIDDAAFGTNYKSIQAGMAYSRLSAFVVRDEQLSESLDALRFTQSEALKLISSDSTTQGQEYLDIDNNFNLIFELFAAASAVTPPTPPAYVFPPPVGVKQEKINARDIIIANRDFLIQEGIAFIEQSLSFNYDKALCQRDIGLIIDAVGYDLMFGSNFRSITAGRSYYRAQASKVIGMQKTATIDSFKFLKTTLTDFLLTDAAAFESVESNMDLIIDIIDQGLSAIPPEYTIPNPTDYDTGFKNARDLIEDNRNFIKAEVIEFIDQNYVVPNSFTYDQTLCERDIDLILDAVYYDMTYRGNLETLIAGRSYYAFGVDSVIPGEEEATLAAYDYLKTLVGLISQDSVVSALQLTVPQVSGDAGSSIAASFAQSLIQDIRDIIAEAPKPEIRFPDLRWVEPSYVVWHNLFQEEKDDTQRLVTNFIDSRFFLLDYDRAVCQRDIGLIIDAIAYDLKFGSNFRTITAGRSYSRGTASVVNGVQKTATIDAFTKLKQLLVPLVAEEGDLSATIIVSDLMDIILNILTEGVSAVPEYVIPNPIGYDVQSQRARDLIEANREFIKAEVIEFIELNYSFLDYDKEKCARDVGFIIDAVSYDMIFQGNFSSVVAGRSYLRGSASLVLTDQKQATIDSFIYLKGLLLDQVAGNFAATSSIDTNMDLIIDIIDNGESVIPGSYTIPNPAGYDVGYQRARDLIEANRVFIEEEVIEFIRVNYVVPEGFTYNEATCREDINYILDAVYYDTTYRGNIQTLTAGRAYFVGNDLQLGVGEADETLAAYDYMKNIIVDIAQNISITPLQVAVSQVTGTAGSLAAANFASDLIEDIRVIIGGTVPVINLPDTSWVDTALTDRFDILLEQRTATSNAVTDYIDLNFALPYDQELCKRDIDLILDAVFYDMTYGGNLETLIAGRAYYSFKQTVIPGEEIATLAAYEYMRDIVIDIAQDIAITPQQAIVLQISDTGSDATAANAAGQLIEDIRTIIATPNSEPAEVTPSLAWVSPVVVAKATALLLSKDQVKTQVTDYIDSRYNTNTVPFTYDREKCKRDVGLIVDALGWDFMFGSNFRSITAGRSYYRANASVVLDRQKKATIEAYEVLRDYVAELVSDNAVAVESVNDNMDMLIDIIDQGVTAVPEYKIPTPFTLDEGIRRARDLISLNREFIKAEVIRFISDNQLSVLNYNKDLCRRDVGLIIDAVGYDMMFGSNFRSITAGRAYYRANASTTLVLTAQKAATLDAFRYLKSLLAAQVAGNNDAVSSVNANMDLIINIIDNGLGVVPAITMPNPSGYDTGFRNARDNIDINRAFINAEVIKFIENNFPSVYSSFDQAACERDISYIIDAMLYDMTYGGNLETLIAGRAYYSNAVLQLGAGEKAATLAAYTFMGALINDVAQNTTVTPLQIVVDQEFGVSSGSPTAANYAENLVGIVISIIDTETEPEAVIPDSAWVLDILEDRFAILQSSKEHTQVQVTDYIDDYYPFEYDRELCQRDVGLIIDAVGYDIMFGSNFRSITAGRSYYRAGAAVVTSIQKAATLDAFTYLKDLMINVVFENSTAVSRVTANMNIILDILDNGLTVVPSFVLPEPTSYDTGFRNARNLIDLNRAFISAEVIEYIRLNYPAVYASFDQAACERDISLILDAMFYDLTYGGNMETIIAGNAYYSNNVSQLGAGEQTATLAAYAFMKSLIINVAQNIDVAELQLVEAQQFDTAGSSAAALAAGDLVEDIRSIIADPNNPPATSNASTIWVAPSLVTQYNSLQTNKNLIKGQVTHYIDVEYVEPSYDQEKCKRDIDLILDAVFYDLTYGGNMETAIAANSYFVDAVTVIPGEVEATISAYTFMKSLVENISRNVTIVPLQDKVDQLFGINGSPQGAALAAQLIEDIITVIRTGTLITAPTLADTSGVSQALIDSYNQTQNEKENVKIAVADFIDSRFFLLTFNREKCKRDIGYIIDALGYDVMFDSNFRSIIAARSYYRANAALVLSAQKSATIGSLRRLKEIALVTAGGDATAEQRIEDRIELIVDIINRGLVAVPAYIIPNPSGYLSGYNNARALVEANREFIKAEVIKFIEDNYSSVYLTFDQTVCERDIDYILDAVFYDITYDTNAESLVAGRSYYVGAMSQVGEGELDATIDSYEFLKTLLGQIAVNTDVVQLQNTVPQVFGAPGSADAANDIEALIQDIVDYIRDPLVAPSLREARTDWVDGALVSTNAALQASKEVIKTQIQQFIETKYSYSQEICARDIGFILDATVYDHLYGGNSQTFVAAETYYSAEVFQIGAREKLMTANTFKFLRSVAGSCLLNIEVTPLQEDVFQDLSNPSVGVEEIIKSNELFTIVAEVVENGFTSIVTLNENIPDFDPQFPDADVTFHQYSLITASGHTFEWVGAGINVNTSLPYLGGLPLADNKAVETNGGKVYWTGTDQFGDFNIGGELVIRRDSGTIEGRTFTKSLFAVLTPYILAVGE